MTREEAIRWLTNEKWTNANNKYKKEWNEAFDLAIEALSEPKTIIGIDIPHGSDKGIATLFKGKDDKLILEEIKEIMSVVRCKDCKHRYMDGEVTHYYWCRLHDRPVDDTDYCAWGEESEVEKCRGMREIWSHEKPPLGCCPADIRARERIAELSQAITRRVQDENPILLAEWAHEIIAQTTIIEEHKYYRMPSSWVEEEQGGDDE